MYRSYEQTLDVPAQNIPQLEIFNIKFQLRQTIWQNWETFQSLK